MFALQVRPSALPVGYPASRQSLPPAAEILPSANRIRPHLHAQPSSIPCDRAPVFSPRPALFVRSSAQERKLTPFFSTHGAFLRSRSSRQLQHSQSVTNSITQEKNLTPTFPTTSPLFLRSFAQERKSSPLLSCACARFREKCMGGAKFWRNMHCQGSSLTSFRQTKPAAHFSSPGICTSCGSKLRYSGGLHSGPETQRAIPVNPL